MRSALLVSILFTTMVVCFAFRTGGDYRDPAHPGKCVVGGKVLSPGQSSVHPKIECSLVQCRRKSFAYINTCSYDLPPQCKYGRFLNKTKHFPGCCDREIHC